MISSRLFSHEFNKRDQCNSFRYGPGNRLAAAMISFPDGSSLHVNFPDLMQPQDVSTSSTPHNLGEAGDRGYLQRREW
jgi:hypothetical protein